MKYYKKIEIDYYDEIVSDTLNYLKNQKPNIYNRTIDATYYVLDLDEFKKFCPKIDLGFERYGIVCNFAVAFVMKTNRDIQVHIDNYPHGDTRINIPILNTKGTMTRFYTGGEFKEMINPITKIRSLKITNISTIKFADMVEIDQPTVIRINEPHSVYMDMANSPRITLTLGFDKDPVFLLED
jgi:hypothetical protein